MEDSADWAALAALERRIDGVATEADETLLARASAGCVPSRRIGWLDRAAEEGVLCHGQTPTLVPPTPNTEHKTPQP